VDFLGRQQHMAFLGGIDLQRDRRRYRCRSASAASGRSAAAMALPRSARPSLLVTKLDRFRRGVAFLATLMDSSVFDFPIAVPGANRLRDFPDR
jgi:hypothetical protein